MSKQLSFLKKLFSSTYFAVFVSLNCGVGGEAKAAFSPPYENSMEFKRLQKHLNAVEAHIEIQNYRPPGYTEQLEELKYPLYALSGGDYKLCLYKTKANILTNQENLVIKARTVALEEGDREGVRACDRGIRYYETRRAFNEETTKLQIESNKGFFERMKWRVPGLR